MNVVCTDDIYAAIRYDISEEVHIYIDSSFDVYPIPEDKETPIKLGVGWVMADKHGRFAGYGVAKGHGFYSPSTKICELRGILKLFLVLRNNFFAEHNENTKFIIYNDNKDLVMALSEMARYVKAEQENPDTAVLNKQTTDFVRRIGGNKKKIRQLCKKFNIEFRWVKGHRDNAFNRLSHDLAYSCYKTMKNNVDFVGETRMDSIEARLQAFHSVTEGKYKNIEVMENTIGSAIQGQEDKLRELLKSL